ncbi:MAG: response regulator transcription factor [Ginsengibacter sp.]
MTHTKINLAIIDDHQIVLDGIQSLLRGNKEINVLIETTDPMHMLELLKQIEIDVLLTDVLMPKMSGDELSKIVKQNFPHIKILALSMSGQGDMVNQMINDADIAGYVLKNIGQQELVTAIKKIASGGIYFSEEVLTEMMKDDVRKKNLEEVHLTGREIEIIKLIEGEKSNREMAAILFLSERTVETHRKNIFRKTKTKNIIGLIKYAYEHNIILK